MAAKRFRVTLEAMGAGGTPFIVVPDAVMAALGPRRRMPVLVTIRSYTYRNSVAPMGGRFLIPVNREHREAAGVAAGDTVTVTLAVDTEERVVDVPSDLSRALRTRSRARTFFEGLSYSHRKEYVDWIVSAKRDETRARRIAKAVEMLEAGTREAR